MFSKLLPWTRSADAVYIRLSRDEEWRSGSFDGENPSLSILRSKPSVARSASVITVRLVVTVLAGYGLLSLLSPHLPSPTQRHQQQPSLSCNCGDTLEEARANDCIYDSLAAAWLPPHCRSAKLTAEFESLGPNEPDPATGNTWGYWHDRNRSRPMTLEEVSLLPDAARRHGAGEHNARFFTTHEWHLVHCIYYWRKMWESARCARGVEGAVCGDGDGEGGRRVLVVEKRYNTLMHINHCMTMMLMRDPLDAIAAEAGVALHSDELHVAKPHTSHEEGDHQGDHQENHQGNHQGGHNRGGSSHREGDQKSGDPYDTMGKEQEHKNGKGDPYDD